MSAILCGKRSSFFDDLPASTPPASKRIRCSSSSPVRYSPSRSSTYSLIDHLAALFPDMDKQVLEKVLEACSNDMDSTIKSLNELRLGSVEKYVGPDAWMTANGEAPPHEDPPEQRSFPKDGGEWVELFVQEMMSASTMDDARARACRALEVLEKSIVARAAAAAEATQNCLQDIVTLRGQLDAVVHENTILKRAVSIQHERQKDFEDKSQELQHLKQMAAHYQEQIRTLEVNNYALSIHLKQAQRRFNPDVF
ncbi:hypothetical protein QQ045_021661 [Rhodiola kirilowii]